MKRPPLTILAFNGSPRLHGNTKTALTAFLEGAAARVPDARITTVDITRHTLSGCIHCDSCKKNGGACVLPDDTAMLIQKVYDADVLILGSPVYWWGISAQLKMVVDKFYSKNALFQKQKKWLGVISVGGNELDDPQYRLIGDQFSCICTYLGWELLFAQGVCAYQLGDLEKDAATLSLLRDLCPADLAERCR